MTKLDLQYLKKLLERVKPKDQFVERGIAIVDRDLAIIDSRRGQMMDNYDHDVGPW